MGLRVRLIRDTEDEAVLAAALSVAALGDLVTGEATMRPDDDGAYYFVSIPIRGECERYSNIGRSML